MQGFDEYMNLVLDDAEEVHLKTKKRRPLGNNVTSLYICKKTKPKPCFLVQCRNKFLNMKALQVSLVKCCNYFLSMKN